MCHAEPVEAWAFRLEDSSSGHSLQVLAEAAPGFPLLSLTRSTRQASHTRAYTDQASRSINAIFRAVFISIFGQESATNMLPGPDTVILCPTCKGKLRKQTWLSGNSFGSKLWSDGYMVASMMPDPVTVTSCPHCSTIFWVADAQEQGDVPEPEYFDEVVEVKRALWFGTKKVRRSGRRDSELASLPTIKHAAIAAIRTALDQLPPEDKPAKEEYARTRLWWAFNDRSRETTDAALDASDEEENRKNLEHLITLVDPNNDQGRLKSASILLALGRFGDARAILALIEEERMFQFRDRFIEAANQSQSKVFRLR